jgi:hypothetical protein
LAWQANEQSQGAPFASRVVNRQRLHEPEHAGVL